MVNLDSKTPAEQSIRVFLLDKSTNDLRTLVKLQIKKTVEEVESKEFLHDFFEPNTTIL